MIWYDVSINELLERTMVDFETALAQYILAIQEKIDAYWESNNYNPDNKPGLSVTEGKRYVRIVKTEHGIPTSVHSFVDTNGDILKAASWKIPAKGVRGSIYNLKAGGFNNFGADYRR